MSIQIVRNSKSRNQIEERAREYYEDVLKGVVDIRRGIVALGGDMHADAEQSLLDDESIQSDLWGFNILLEKEKEECLVYESFINVRPGKGNKKLEVEDPLVREQMRNIIHQRILL